jgi:hypothetical protein
LHRLLEQSKAKVKKVLDLTGEDEAELDEEKLEDPEEDFPAILYLDSLHLHSQEKISRTMRAYLVYEWMNKKQSDQTGSTPLANGAGPEDIDKTLKNSAFTDKKGFPNVDCSRVV